MSMTYKLSEIMPPAFFELHRRIRAGEVTEALCEGGRGGAKSSFISEEIELQMMRHPDTHAVVLRRKENTLRRTVYNQYIWAAGALGVGSKWKATVSPMELTYLPTGQKIMFFGLDDPGNLKSIKLPFGYVAYVHFEELDQFRGPEEVRNVYRAADPPLEAGAAGHEVRRAAPGGGQGEAEGMAGTPDRPCGTDRTQTPVRPRAGGRLRLRCSYPPIPGRA